MHTEIIMLTDVSGSMAKVDRAACDGFNTFIREQREVPGTADVTFIRFNTRWDVNFSGPIQKVPSLSTLGANGGTALYDTLVETLGAYTSLTPTAHYKIFVVLTDGEDLNSRKFTKKDAAAAVHRARQQGWQFVFLGANIDAEETAAELGIDRQLAYQFNQTDEGTRGVYAQASATTRAMRSWGL